MSATKSLNEQIGIEGPTTEEMRDAKPQKSIMLGVCKFITGACAAVTAVAAAAPSLLPPEYSAGAMLGSIFWGLLAHVVKEDQNKNAVLRQQTAFVDDVCKRNPASLTIEDLGKLAMCADEDLQKLPIPLQVEVAEAERDYLYHTAKQQGKLSKEAETRIDVKKPVGRDKDSLSRLLVERDYIYSDSKLDNNTPARPWIIARSLGVIVASLAGGLIISPESQERSMVLMSTPMAISTLALKNGTEPPTMDQLPSVSREISDARKLMDKPVVRKARARPEPQ